MSTPLALLGLALAILGLASASNVIDVTGPADFEAVKEYDIALVEFFAPWCGHCKKLAPEFEKAADKLAASDPDAKLVKVDCTTDGGKTVCGTYGVSGYPTLKLFRNGEATDYEGGRDASGIIKFMQKQAGPASVLIADAEALHKKLDDAPDNVVGGFFASEYDAAQAFMKKASSLRDDYKFFHILDAAVWKDLHLLAGVEEDSIVLFRPKFMKSKADPSQVVLTGDLKQALADNEEGLVGYATESSRDRFVDRSLKEKLSKFHIIAYGDVSPVTNPSNLKYVRNRLIKVAKEELEARFSVAVGAEFSADLEKYGITGEEQLKRTTVVAVDDKKKPYVMTTEFSPAAVKEFIVKLKAGEVEPFIKSEPIPEANDEAVKVVVGKTFEAIVNDPTKDVLIEFYAPWCGHCKTLEPKYKDAAIALQKLKGYENVVIAKMDATANDVPANYAVSGFPTLYWAPAGGKDTPMKYSGGREEVDFINFVKKEHKIEKTEL